MESPRLRTSRYLRRCLYTLRQAHRERAPRQKLRLLLVAIVYYESAIGAWTTSEELRFSVKRVAREINRLLKDVEMFLPDFPPTKMP